MSCLTGSVSSLERGLDEEHLRNFFLSLSCCTSRKLSLCPNLKTEVAWRRAPAFIPKPRGGCQGPRARHSVEQIQEGQGHLRVSQSWTCILALTFLFSVIHTGEERKDKTEVMTPGKLSISSHFSHAPYPLSVFVVLFLFYLCVGKTHLLTSIFTS